MLMWGQPPSAVQSSEARRHRPQFLIQQEPDYANSFILTPPPGECAILIARGLRLAQKESPMQSKKLSLALTVVIALINIGTPSPAFAQQFQVLYNFAYNSGPFGGVVFDAAGNMYGTTFGGGTYKGGTVYELSPQAGGGWTETI